MAYVYLCVTNLTVESKSRSDWQQQILYLNREALSHLLIQWKILPSACPYVQCSRSKFLHWYHAVMMIELLLIWVKFISSRHEYSYSGVDCHYFLHLSSIISCYRHKDTHKSVSYSSLLLFLFLLLLLLSLFFFASLFSLSLSMFVR